MASQFLRPRPSFPRINRNHPLAQGLVMDAQWNGASFIDLVQELLGSNPAAPAKVGSPVGWAADYDGISQYSQISPNRSQDAQNAVTIELLVKPQDGATAKRFISLVNSTPATIWLVRSDPSTNSFAFAIGAWTNFPGWASQNGSFVNNAWAHIFITHPNIQSAVATPTFIINGVKTTSYAFSVAPTGSYTNVAASLFRLGANSAAIPPTSWSDCVIAYARYWNRALSDQEGLQLYADPFQIYKKKTLLAELSAYASPLSRYNIMNTVGM